MDGIIFQLVFCFDINALDINSYPYQRYFFSACSI